MIKTKGRDLKSSTQDSHTYRMNLWLLLGKHSQEVWDGHVHIAIFKMDKLLLLLLSCFSRVRLFETPWTAAYQAPLPMGFSRQE